MVRKISVFLILVFALNMFSASFHPSAVFAKDKTNIEKQKEDETKSAFIKALETVWIPFAYALHWFQVKLYGPIEVGVNYNIQIDKVYKPTSKPNVYTDEPGKKVENVKILLPVILLNNKTKVITKKDFLATINAKRKNFMKELKKTPIDYYKIHSLEYKKIKAEDVDTKYSNMIELTFLGEVNPRFKIELNVGGKPRKINNIFPYHLSNEYSLAYEEKLSDESEEAGKGYFERHQKIATYIYVYWEGKAELELQFWIGMGARFGQAGSNGMAYEFSKEQPDKTVVYGEIPGRYGGVEKNWLIFKKPGWYKVYMDKISDISVL